MPRPKLPSSNGKPVFDDDDLNPPLAPEDVRVLVHSNVVDLFMLQELESELSFETAVVEETHPGFDELVTERKAREIAERVGKSNVAAHFCCT